MCGLYRLEGSFSWLYFGGEDEKELWVGGERIDLEDKDSGRRNPEL